MEVEVQGSATREAQAREEQPLPTTTDWPVDDPEFVERTVQENLGLVWKCVGKYRRRLQVFLRREVTEEDLDSYALEALWRAVVHFRPELGWRFSTYAVASIERALHRRTQYQIKRAQPLGLSVKAYEDLAPTGKESVEDFLPNLSSNASPEERILAKETLLEVLRTDPEVVQCLVKGLSQTAAAEELGVSQASVSRRISRLRRLFAG